MHVKIVSVLKSLSDPHLALATHFDAHSLVSTEWLQGVLPQIINSRIPVSGNKFW